jgi:bifunctional UDP-N-acetylglucosamine pyrophosphorylase/glucosamine-1-phosphate N-acetyltransferase
MFSTHCAPPETRTAVVVGPDHAQVADEARRVPDAEFYIQSERRGGPCGLAAKAAIARGVDDVLVVFGDTPLVSPVTLGKLRAALADGVRFFRLVFRPHDPTGYGRLVTTGGELVAIREHADANESERAITLCNGGLMALAGKHALAILNGIGSDNRKHEFYLTDAVSVARKMALRASAIEVTEDEVRGINTKTQLAEAEAVLQARLRAAALDAGVTLVAPETVFLSADTKFGKDVVVEPYVVFKPGVVVEDGATIRSFSHLDGAHVGKTALSASFARLRAEPSSARAYIGNFVEVKEARIDAGASQSSDLHRRFHRGRGRQRGRGHHHLQLRRRRQAPDRDRQGRLHRLELGSGRPRQNRRRGLCWFRLGHPHDVPAGSLALGRARQVVKEGAAERAQHQVRRQEKVGFQGMPWWAAVIM